MSEAKKNVQKLSEEELDLVSGGNREETQAVCNAFLAYAKKNAPAQEYAALKNMTLEQLADKLNNLSKGGNFGGIELNLYTDGRPNSYSQFGIEMSHADVMKAISNVK